MAAVVPIVMLGGTGDDLYTVGLAGDRTIELAGQGIDTVVTYVSSYGMEDNVERMIMASSIFSASGNDLDNTIVGGTNANLIYGQSGRDYILGGSGNDVVIGGADGDTLFGQAGADRFDYNAVSDSFAGAANRDQIADFEHGVDRIDLASILAGDSFSFLGTGAFTGTDEEVRFTTYGNNKVVDIDTTGDGHADMQILLSNVTTLDAGDFIL